VLEIKVDFILELQSKFKKTKYPDVMDKEIESMIRDVRRYLANRGKGFKTNQQYLGMQALFRGYAIIA